MNDGAVFTKEQYAAMNARKIAIEREMDALKATGVTEADERMKKLYSEWEMLEYNANV